MPRLKLPTAPRTAVFREIERILRADPILSSVVRDTSFLAWNGKPTDANELSTSMAPALRLTPTSGPDEWLFPGSQKGWLFINVEMLIVGHDADDLQNLWWAIVRAIYPIDSDARFANVRSLNAAGAYDGLARFMPPADPAPESSEMRAVGQIRIEVKNDINN